ncbi:MAG: site-2 protease family protein [Bacillota bacterium]|nr:site-2 protease family protein [Bacillota bacterium]
MDTLQHFLAYPLREIPFVALTLLIAFTVHEFSHAYVAYKFGDLTAKKQGRVTLNPMSHIDPLGALMIFIAGFGWARPVPVNRFFFKRPRLAGILVTIAGPISNFVMACVGFLVVYSLAKAGIGQNLPSYVTEFFNIFIPLNVVLFIFNLLPLPPLDGYRILEDLLPNDLRSKMTQYESYGSFVFLLLVLTPLNNYTIQPIFNVVLPLVMDGMDRFFYMLFY